MALIIEDGSIVANANSYTTDSELIAYASARGVTIPVLEADRDILQIKAVDFINSNESDMQGIRTDSTQVLSFPRVGVYANDYYVESDVIPLTLKNAQLEAAIVAYTQTLITRETTQNIQKEKVDALEVSYFANGKRTKTNFNTVFNYLSPVLKDVNKLVRT